MQAKKRRILLVTVSVLLLAIAGGGIWMGFHLWTKDTSSGLTLYGNVDIRQAELAFPITERVQRMLVEEGDRVKPGQLLAELDKTRLLRLVDQARAEMQAQRKILDRLESGSRTEEIQRARADVAAARADFQNAKRRYARMKALVKSGAVSHQEADNAEAAFKSARARLAAARKTLQLLEKGPRQEDIEQAGAALESAKARLAVAEQNLKDASLYAPQEGIIRDRILEPGDLAAPQRPAYALALTDPVWIRTYIPEPDLGKIKPGMNATVTTDTFPDKTYNGWVGYISPTAEFTPKTVQTPEVRTQLVFQVRIIVNNPSGELRLGMPATVNIPIDASNGTSH